MIFPVTQTKKEIVRVEFFSSKKSIRRNFYEDWIGYSESSKSI